MALKSLRSLRDHDEDDGALPPEVAESVNSVPAAGTATPLPIARGFPLEDLLPYVVKGLDPRGEEAEREVIVHLLGPDALSRAIEEVRRELTIEILSKAPDLATADETTLTSATRDSWIGQQVAKFGPTIALMGRDVAALLEEGGPSGEAVTATEAASPAKLNLRKLGRRGEDVIADDVTPAEMAAARAETEAAARPREVEDEYAALKDVIVPSKPPSPDDPMPLRREAPAAATAVHAADRHVPIDGASPGGKGTTAPPEGSNPDPLAGTGPADPVMPGATPPFPIGGPAANGRDMDRDGYGGGNPRQPMNALDTLINVAAAPVIGAAMGLAFGAQKFRQILASRSRERGFSPDAVRDRIFAAKVDELRSDAVGMVEAGEELGRDVESFNEAFLATAAARKLGKIAEAEGKTIEAVLHELTSGKGKPEHLAVAREAMADDAVKSAWDRLDPGLAKLDERRIDAQRDLEKLARNFGDRIDAETEANGLAAAHKAATDKIPAPVFEDPEAGEKLKDRLRKMAESMIEWAKELLAKLVSTVSSAVKPK